MSVPFTDARCTKCSKHWGSYLLWGGFHYRIGPSRTIRIDRDLGWCHPCAEFRAVEVLPARSRLEAQLEQHRKKLKEAEDKARSRVLSKLFRSVVVRDERLIALNRAQVEEIMAALAWRDSRRSPPRCLECGGTDIDHIGTIGFAPDPHRIALKHPGCGGGLLVSTPEFRINMRTEDRLYDAEGRLLEAKDPVPPGGRIDKRFLDS